jgi:hypothetical protein
MVCTPDNSESHAEPFQVPNVAVQSELSVYSCHPYLIHDELDDELDDKLDDELVELELEL